MISNGLVDAIKRSEGFKGMPYEDSLGKPTIGYGTLLPLSELESAMILRSRLLEKMNELINQIPWIVTQPKDVQDVVYEMSYQMGVAGVLKFKNMLKALQDEDYERAGDEALDSKWAKQTPNRARKLAHKLKSVS